MNKLVALMTSLIMTLLTAHSAMALSVGDKAPQIIGRDISGSLFALSRLEKKPKVINFFWVQCKPCQKELPLLAQKEKKYPGVIFSAIHAELNQDTGSNYNIEDIQAFATSLKAHPKSLVLGSNRLKKEFGVQGFPATVLLSSDNTVEKILYGFNDKTVKQLNAWLQKQK